jgi:hypothetical protein
VLQASVSSVVELVLGHSTGEASRLEGHRMKIYSLLLALPLDQARWADHLGRQQGDSRRPWLSSIEQNLSWRPCGHLPHLFGIWYQMVLVDQPHQ